jgi:hypothetical protein
VGVRLTRRAKNGLRWIGGTVEEAESVVANPTEKDFDREGNSRYRGFIAGERCRVVVALDDPDLIISIHHRRRH